MEILELCNSVEDSTKKISILIKIFDINREFTIFNCPTLHVVNHFIAIDPSKVEGILNVQHNCDQAHCQESKSRPIKQERDLTSNTCPQIAHTNEEVFILNIFALKSWELISDLIPYTPTILDIDGTIKKAKANFMKRRITKRSKAVSVGSDISMDTTIDDTK
jgi:hypothetical protein